LRNAIWEGELKKGESGEGEGKNRLPTLEPGKKKSEVGWINGACNRKKNIGKWNEQGIAGEGHKS